MARPERQAMDVPEAPNLLEQCELGQFYIPTATGLMSSRASTRPSKTQGRATRSRVLEEPRTQAVSQSCFSLDEA